jgi:hypothetical protein
MGARKLERQSVQLMSLDAITVDRSLQSRVATSIEYQREFSEAMLRGDEFPPVVVFFDGKKNWLADGFTRHGAAKKAGKRAIRAEVRAGTKRDALIYSAGANQKFSIPRTPEDIRKAVEMILSDAEGFRWGLDRIAKHVGISPATVRRHRAVYLSERGLEEPEEVLGADGETYSAKGGSATPPGWRMEFRDRGSKGKFYEARRGGGRKIYLSSDRAVAEAKLQQLKDEDRPVIPKASHVSPTRINCDDHLKDWLARKGFGFRGHHELGCPAVSGYHGFGRAYVYTEEMTGVNFLVAVGRVLLLRQKLDPSARPVVVCWHDTFQKGPVELARQIGIEVMTAEEFLDSLQADKEA